MGIDNLAVSLSEEKDTLEDVYEPYLIQEGFIVRTPKGRVASQRAFKASGVDYPFYFQQEFNFDGPDKA